MKNPFLRRQTNYAGGISAGGSDTGFDIYAQPTLFAKTVSQIAEDVVIPAGSIILSTHVIPEPGRAATAGTVTMTPVSPAGAAIVSALPANAYDKTDVVAPAALAQDTTYRITPAGIPAGQRCAVGVTVITPRIRS